MPSPRLFFHRISYAQYPFMLLGVFFCYRPLFANLDALWVDMNLGLVFMGIGVSFATLQDTTKTQNNLSKRIFMNPRYTRWFMITAIGLVIFFLGFGLLGLLALADGPLHDLGYGLVSLGVGFVGLIKGAAEIAENLQASAP
jgi:magnesium-transporting ATPase (P-type)